MGNDMTHITYSKREDIKKIQTFFFVDDVSSNPLFFFSLHDHYIFIISFCFVLVFETFG
jgi:hypothetical protein